ncbi:hypothetical protein E2P81_ATG07611 [Venturia nashicola]|nr:hypothetical protein E2P81_ATG07611 [Venturia nashicola]
MASPITTNTSYNHKKAEIHLEISSDPTTGHTLRHFDHGNNSMDDEAMRRLGKTQELDRNFNWFHTLAFTTVIMATWEILLLVNNQALANGGRPGFLYSYMWSVVGFAPIVLSLAEMSSMAPTSGGQYHWVSEFAPKQFQRFLSYMTGWMSVLSWQSNSAAAGFLASATIQVLVYTNDPTAPDPDPWTIRWQGTLLSIVALILVAAANIWATRLLPATQYLLFFVHTAGYISLITLFWVLPKKHVSASEVFGQFENFADWSSIGLALMVGQISAAYALISADAAAHLSEEVKDAGLTVPRSMVRAFLINVVMGLLLIISFLFAMPNVYDAINYAGGTFSFYYVYTQMMNEAGVNGVSIIGIILLIGGNLNINVSTARQTFAFARDNGLPFSEWISKVHRRSHVPRNAVYTSLIISIALNLVNLGSTSAFQAMISLQLSSIMLTYCVSISCILHRRLQAQHSPSDLSLALPSARWSLGKWGPLINTLAIFYSGFVFFWSFWPVTRKVDMESMNYAVVIFGGVVFLALG